MERGDLAESVKKRITDHASSPPLYLRIDYKVCKYSFVLFLGEAVTS